MPQWFPRFGDIPEIEYRCPVEIDTTTLPQHATHPGRNGFWPVTDVPGSSTTASPARQRFNQLAQQSPDPNASQYRAAEALELPGYLTDYALILSRAIAELWVLRARAGWIPEALERWCRLGFRLAAIYQENPSAFAETLFDSPGVVGASTLIELYSREGYLLEAIEIAEHAASLGYQAPELDSLKMRLDNIRHEHVNS